MKTDINDYKITNHDGVDTTVSNEGKQSFANDDIRSIKENSTSGVRENVSVGETYDDRSKKYSDGSSGNSAKNSSKSGNGDASSSSSSSSASSATSSATSSAASTAASSAATSAASAIGGSMGAIAGSVAASVMTAVMVVAVFVSTLTINLSLVMASMTGLVFQVELKGAQEEDFVNPIVAILEDDTGVCGEIEILPDTLYLTFEDLEPGKEYVVTVKNDEKVFFKKSFLTATEQVEKGSVYVSSEETQVFVTVENVELKAGEYYTVTVKDAKGNVLFAKDGTDVSAEYTFELAEPQSVFVSLSVGAKTYAVSQFIVEKREENNSNPLYDFDHPTWDWSEDYTEARLFFVNVKGGDELEFFVKTEIVGGEEPTCFEQGFVEYSAYVEFDGREFTDRKTEFLPPEHNLVLVDEIAPTEDAAGIAAHYECSICHILFDLDYNDVDEKDLLIELEYDYANPVWTWSEDYSVATLSFEELHGGKPLEYKVESSIRIREFATCDQEGTFYYYAELDLDSKGLFQGVTDDFTEYPLGHSYGKPVFEWTEIGDGYTAMATFVCERDESHVEILNAQVYKESGGYSAMVEFEGRIYEDFMPIEGHESDQACEIFLSDGNLCINPDGYARSESGLSNPTPFVSSKSTPYLIQNQEESWCDNIIQVYNSYPQADIYIKLKDTTLSAGSWCSLFLIKATGSVNIYLLIEGNVTFEGGSGQQIFSSQGTGSPSVNIYIDRSTFGGTFNAEVTDGLTYAQTGTINVHYV